MSADTLAGRAVLSPGIHRVLTENILRKCASADARYRSMIEKDRTKNNTNNVQVPLRKFLKNTL